MIFFFRLPDNKIIAAESSKQLTAKDTEKLCWLFGNAEIIDNQKISGWFCGPRREMITPWSTNAVEITQNMGIEGIIRIEEFEAQENAGFAFDPMLKAAWNGLDQNIFRIDIEPEKIKEIDDIDAYNQSEGLALSPEEVDYLKGLSKKLDRKLTDSEVYGFAQVNSEHCRHKIFNGIFTINGEEKKESLFALIKKTSKTNPNFLVSAYRDNVAFILGPGIRQFAPKRQDKADFFELKPLESIISLKAETHNFPTTVEPFNGASTGTGGEIRDRMAGGKGSLPLAGTAVYMCSYPRNDTGRDWEKQIPERQWLYQTPEQILIKASNGASDFGNKFGQPLVCGSLLTFEHEEDDKKHGFDKVIMLAGGIGYGKKSESHKDVPEEGDIIVLLGGDNYRIGMGGGAVSSVATGEFGQSIELNAVQRANPEMQKRVYNAIRAMSEMDINPLVSIHDHGAGGHLNCLSELVEETGGKIDISKLPVGDPTLSAKEIIGNESQERMGMVIRPEKRDILKKTAERERSPYYEVGEVTGDKRFSFTDKEGKKPIDLDLMDFFGNPPRTLLYDQDHSAGFAAVENKNSFTETLKQVLRLEAVACKDWLTNKVDRSVTGRIAMQQCAGPLQLPLNNLGVVALDYDGEKGIATSIGHAPVAGLKDPEKASRLSIAEALTNIIWAPLTHGLKGVSLSANWMWPAKNDGENARLYRAVEAVSEYACALGINIPTGKDSLSMTQKYPNGDVVYSPGTVIISGVAEVSDIKKAVSPVIDATKGGQIVYLPFSDMQFATAGSSYAQVCNKIGSQAPDGMDAETFAKNFAAIQELIANEEVYAGHDIGSGGLITSLLEMCFASNNTAMDIQLDKLSRKDINDILFSEQPGIMLQISENGVKSLDKKGIAYHTIGSPKEGSDLIITSKGDITALNIAEYRDIWYRSSAMLDKKQSGEEKALERYENYKNQALEFRFPEGFEGKGVYDESQERKSKAAIIREKGVNGDREMAYSLYASGFDVKDIHMTDLISGMETLEDVQMIVFVGGFSNSDVLGSAKGWAGAFRYNEKARKSLEAFYARPDTLSLGICNGCQLMVELGLIKANQNGEAKMLHNESGKFESAFLNVDILENQSVMLRKLAGSKLGVWVAHGEGKYELPGGEDNWSIAVKYSHAGYPGNPNGSNYNTAAICSADGRHLAMMPHLERAVFPWQWAHYPAGRKDVTSPWLTAFEEAREWILSKK